MRVSRIQRIHGYGVFRDFSWPADLSDFSRFNLIYGWNGTGKTTLSNLFAHLATRAPVSKGDVEFRVDELVVTNANIGTIALPPVRVFNRRSIDTSVLEVPGQQLSPIYFFGEDSVEKQSKIEELKRKLEKAQQDVGRRYGRLSSTRDDFETFCTDHARLIRELLASPGGDYLNYDKRDFKSATSGLTSEAAAASTLSDVKKQELKSIKDGKPKEKIEEIRVRYPDISNLTTDVGTLLRKSVVSKVLEELVVPEIASWVQTGLTLHAGSKPSSTCHFCGQEIPKDRLTRLSAHFSDELRGFQNEIEKTLSDVEAAMAVINGIRPPERSALYDHLAQEYRNAVDLLGISRANAVRYLDTLRHALTAKKERPFESMDLPTFASNAKESTSTWGLVYSALTSGAAAFGRVVGISALGQANAQIALHNAYTDNFSEEVRLARRTLEMSYVAEAFPEYEKKAKAITDARAAVDQATKSVEDIRLQIRELEKSIRQHQKPGEELTREMRAYLGHNELTFTTHDTGYTVTREGNVATNLSEGERTAVALLYFLKSLQDTSFNLREGVVVIDDPVSSLDSNAIFSAFGFIRERTKDAGQLFVLTHNFPLFRQVKNWFHHLPGQRKKDIALRPARFFMLKTSGGSGRRRATLGQLDPLLEQFESEYHYLFKRVHADATRSPEEVSLEENYGMPNIARRMLEAFLAFRLPDKAPEFAKQLELIPFDVARKARILRFLHTHSHHGVMSEPEHDISILTETQAVLRDVLDLVSQTDPEHFNAMVSLVAGDAQQEREF